MKIYGYKKNCEKEYELSESSLLCSLEEINKLIEFLKYAKEYFSDEKYMEEPGHIHYKDWDENWKNNSSDFIIVYDVSNNK